MLNPFQKSNLKIATPQGKFNNAPIKDEDKPGIVECFENVMGAEVTTRRSGRATMACCPFHGENHPSFAMYEDTNSYYCFTCGVKGDSYKFLMEMLEIGFKEAKEYAETHHLYI